MLADIIPKYKQSYRNLHAKQSIMFRGSHALKCYNDLFKLCVHAANECMYLSSKEMCLFIYNHKHGEKFNLYLQRQRVFLYIVH